MELKKIQLIKLCNDALSYMGLSLTTQQGLVDENKIYFERNGELFTDAQWEYNKEIQEDFMFFRIKKDDEYEIKDKGEYKPLSNMLEVFKTCETDWEEYFYGDYMQLGILENNNPDWNFIKDATEMYLFRKDELKNIKPRDWLLFNEKYKDKMEKEEKNVQEQL